jgi:hypothetical protein
MVEAVSKGLEKLYLDLKADQISMRTILGSGVDEKGECPDSFKCNICLTLVYLPE